MIRLRHKIFIYALRVLDQTLLFVTLGGVVAFGAESGGERLLQLLHGQLSSNDLLGLLVLGLAWLAVFNALVHYETNRLKSLRSQVFDVIRATTASAFLLMLAASVFDFARISREAVVIFWLIATCLCVLTRLLLRWTLMAVRRSGYNYRHLLILGFNEQAVQMAQRIDANPVLGYKIHGFISEHDEPGARPRLQTPYPVMGTFKDLQAILEKGPVDEIILCVPFMQHIAIFDRAVRLAQELGIVVRMFPDKADSRLLSRLHIERFEGDHVVTLFREQMLMQLLLKRLMDIVLSAVGLIVLSPLLLIAALAIKLSSPGPVLFAQERVGMNKRLFKLYKFRSMYADAEKRRSELEHLNEMDGPVFKIKNDPRITPIGRFIRKTSIDELPQLLNVLRGQMSLVGPRPPLPAEVDQYEWLYRRRLSIKPGITCLWQISGRNEISFKQWMEMDKAYIDSWSLWLDVKILAKTIPAVVFSKGAS
ncbi:MAG TPA: sugar transferase [Rubrivivax sp.]|nr:sugar transferase [Rubrivivax sp.]